LKGSARKLKVKGSVKNLKNSVKLLKMKDGENLSWRIEKVKLELEYWPMPNVMAALPNIGGALCSTPQSVADAHYWSAMQ